MRWPQRESAGLSDRHMRIVTAATLCRTKLRALRGRERRAGARCWYASRHPSLERTVAKAKPPSARPSVPSHRRAPAPNPRLDLQTRKVLQKHYRARHGVK